MKVSATLGAKNERLTLIEVGPPGTKRVHRMCTVRCDCGTVKQIRLDAFKAGRTKSCGCIDRERDRRTCRLTHGLSQSRTYSIWSGMNQRCINPKVTGYESYGGRGISVCPRWSYPDGFKAFLEDMGERPPGMSIDRIDVNGNYEPANCRWATVIEQARNKTNSRRFTHDGLTMTIAEWSERTGIPLGRIWKRLEDGWDVGNALTTPPRAIKSAKAG